MPLAPGTRVLVLSLDGIGDQVLRQPLLAGLTGAGAEVTVLVQDGFEAAVRLVEPRVRVRGVALGWEAVPAADAFRALVRELDALDPQLIVSAAFDPVCYADGLVRALQPVPAAGFVGGRRQEVPGWASLEAALDLPARVPLAVAAAPRFDAHEHDKALALVHAITGATPPPGGPSLHPTVGSIAAARQVRETLGLADGPFIACCPAGTRNVTVKAWPAERYAQVLAAAFRTHRVPALVLGHESERAVVEEVVDRARRDGATAAPWLGGGGELEVLAGLLGQARLYLGNDTGAMHLAAGLGLPIVAVFGGGHWPRFLPLAREGAVHTQALPCFGCGWRECLLGDGSCVAGVDTARVSASVDAVLAGAAAFRVHAAEPPDRSAVANRAVAALRWARRGQAAPDEPLVTIVTPCLDAVGTIGATLESVREQTHPAIQHLVVDGGSTDGTLDVLASAPRLQWITARDGGMYEALHRGLQLAGGDLLAYQNADDAYAGPDAVERVVEAFAAHPDVDVVYGDFEYVDEDGRALEVVKAPEFSLAALRRYNFVPPHSTFVRRRVVHELGFWPDPSLRYAGDWDWFLRIAIGGCRFLHLPRVLSRFRRRRAALTATVGLRQKIREWKVICLRTGTPLLPLILNETAWIPLKRRLLGS